MTIELRVWQLVAVVSLLALSGGLLVGRYAVPAQTAPPGTKIDLPGGGSVYMSDEATRQYEAAKRRSHDEEGATWVRAAVPALEAWSADHGGYTGATVRRLQNSYDAGIRDVRVATASHSTYCVESAGGTVAYSKRGPAADIVRGGC